MGLFGKSKQDLISRYEKNLKEKDYIIHNLQMENESLKQDIMHKKYEINELMSNQKQYIELNRTDELILCAGRYRGGINIPVGIYDLIIVSGTGIIHSKNPEYVFIRLESNPEICKKNNWPNTYNGFVVSDESVFEIDQSAQIKFILSQKIDLDKELKKYLDKKNEIEKEIDYLEQIKKIQKTRSWKYINT